MVGGIFHSASDAVAAQDLLAGRVVVVKEVDASSWLGWAEEPEDVFYLGEQLPAAFEWEAPVRCRLSHESVDGYVESSFIPVGGVVLLFRRRW